MAATLEPKLDSYSVQLKSLDGLDSKILRFVYPEGYFYISKHEVQGKNLKVWKFDIDKAGKEFYHEFLVPIKNVNFILEKVVKGNMRYNRKAKFNRSTGSFSDFQAPEEE